MLSSLLLNSFVPEVLTNIKIIAARLLIGTPNSATIDQEINRAHFLSIYTIYERKLKL